MERVRSRLADHELIQYFKLVSHVPGPQPSQVVCQFLLKTHHPSQRTHNDPWNPQECRIERGPQTFRIPTEPVVEAQCRRLRPLITVSETHLNEGYGRTHLPPPPLEAGCFSSECFAQIIANDYLHEPRLYDLNPSEWKAEVVRLFSQTEYHTMRNALVRLVERTLVQQGDRFITLLALSAAVQEESEIHNRWLLPAEDDERMNKLTGEWSEIFKLVIQCFHVGLLYSTPAGRAHLSLYSCRTSRSSSPPPASPPPNPPPLTASASAAILPSFPVNACNPPQRRMRAVSR